MKSYSEYSGYSLFSKTTVSGDFFQKRHLPSTNQNHNLKYVVKKLKAKEIKETREQLAASQGMRCGLCQLPISLEDNLHLDHDHKTGLIRGTLHSRCNTTLGVIERAMVRYGFKSDAEVHAFLNGVSVYLSTHQEDQHELIHPSHKTTEEKKALAKKRRKRKLTG